MIVLFALRVAALVGVVLVVCVVAIVVLAWIFDEPQYPTYGQKSPPNVPAVPVSQHRPKPPPPSV